MIICCNPLLCLPHELLSLILQFLDISSKFSLNMTYKVLIHLFHVKESLYDIRIDAILNNHTKLFKWLDLLNNDCTDDTKHELCIVAAKSDNIEILKYVLNNQTPSSYEQFQNILLGSATGGSLEITKWLDSNRSRYDGSKAIDSYDVCIKAAENGHLTLLKWLIDNGYLNLTFLNATISNSTIKNGHFDIVRYLHENGCHWNEWSCTIAAENGHLEILKYLHKNGRSWDRYTCMGAAENGHLEVLKYLHENGCPWDTHSFFPAIENGHLNILRYLHENGCHWNVYVCSHAVKNGHFDVVRYLHENGCPWNENECTNAAARNGHFDILKYLQTGVHETRISI